jgi:enoyl-CoA hydratase/carnithine racemase
VANEVTREDRGAVRVLRIGRPEKRDRVNGVTAAALARAIRDFAEDASARVPRDASPRPPAPSTGSSR